MCGIPVSILCRSVNVWLRGSCSEEMSKDEDRTALLPPDLPASLVPDNSSPQEVNDSPHFKVTSTWNYIITATSSSMRTMRWSLLKGQQGRLPGPMMALEVCWRFEMTGCLWGFMKYFSFSGSDFLFHVENGCFQLQPTSVSWNALINQTGKCHYEL